MPKKKSDYIDWNELNPIMDEIYKIIEDRNIASPKFIERYLTECSNLTKEAIKKLTAQIVQSQNEDRRETGYFPKSLLFRKVFTFQNYQYWDDELNDAALKFREEFTIFPNILIMNKETTKRIDLIANNLHREKMQREDEAEITDLESTLEMDSGQNEFGNLTSFVASNFSLEFAIDESLPNKKFILVFDSDPIWGGEDEQEESPEIINEKKDKKIA